MEYRDKLTSSEEIFSKTLFQRFPAGTSKIHGRLLAPRVGKVHLSLEKKIITKKQTEIYGV